MGDSSKLGGLNRFAIGWLGFAGGLVGVLMIGVEWFLVLDDADWIGFSGVLGWFRLFVDLHSLEGFGTVVGMGWPRICANARELFGG